MRVEEKLDKNTKAISEKKEENKKLRHTRVEDKEEERPEEGIERVRRIFEKMGVGRIRDEEVIEVRRIGEFRTGTKTPMLVKLKNWDKK
ncbi:hypothetical protein FQA39_LY14811 [Lamprigera yunnana]|nr:hypothetical protein FQA39_LY14811 [Lamprigera yunnana]